MANNYNPDLPILIIGAGLGGLSLAHSLHDHGIPFKLLERDLSPAFRAQGYRIRIQDFYLKQLLSPDLWNAFEKCCSEAGPFGRMIDAVTGQASEGGFGAPRGGPGGPTGGARPSPAMSEGTPMNVDRRVLRNLMIQPMVEKGLVEFGKKLVGYEILHDGVLAKFSDGSAVKGRLLVGADGSRSMVRKQLAPEFKLLDTEGRAIFGKTITSSEMTGKIPKDLGKGICIISDTQDSEKPCKLFTDNMNFTNRATVPIELPPDYIYWVLIMRNDRLGMPDEHFMTLPTEDAVKASIQYTTSWHPSCQELLRSQVPDQTSTLAFATTHPDCTPWTTNSRVTLLGDAAHPMTPVGGVGANAAFQDAMLLSRAILAGGGADELVAYEREMLENARRYVGLSAMGAGRMFGMKPVEELPVWKLWT